MTEAKKTSGAGASNLREYGLLIAFVAIVVFFTVILRVRDGVDFLSAQNITNVFLQNAHIIIMALGMLLVIVAGHIDLSVGSVAAFVGAISATMTVDLGLPMYVVIPASLLAGGLIGAYQGYWVAYWRIPAFIVTLSGMLVFRGLTMWMLQGKNIGPFPKSFQGMSTGFIPDLAGTADEALLGVQRMNVTAMAIVLVAVLLMIWQGTRKRKQDASFGIQAETQSVFVLRNAVIAAALMFVAYKLSVFRGLPNVLIVMSALIVLFAFFTENTVMGRWVYAIGGNLKAARLSGINADRLTFLTFVNMGVLAALAGMIVTARLNSATPKAGVGFELDVIAAVFIGGASTMGGSGKIVGVVVGAFIMGVMNNGMSLMGIGIDYQQVIKGLVLLIAVIFDVYNKSK
jgi:putative multiple sugar transport system permease protein